MFVKTVIIVMLLLIVGSLFSALLFMYREKGQSGRMARALTARVALSIALFVFVMLAFYFGLLPAGDVVRR